MATQAKHLIEGEPNLIANLANLSALFAVLLDRINWVGFYLRDGEELVLGPFQGKPACIRIPFGQGVCGTAAHTGEAQVVPDVYAFAGHIACDADSRSEIVLPIRRDGHVVGVLDIDSPLPGRFTDADRSGLEEIVAIIEKGCDFTAY
ncbi:MAG: GAF domain-containing protein [Firmicutes bacterium]|nr:GAF domain-containing protein [Bacillota bacterium]